MTGFLTVGGAIVLAYYAILFVKDNAAPTISEKTLSRGLDGQFHFKIEECIVRKHKLALRGWIVRRGQVSQKKTVRAFVLDQAGRARAIKTTLRQRDDLDALFAKQLHDDTRYRHAGFVASVRLGVTGISAARNRFYLEYIDEDVSALLPFSCPENQLP